MPCFRKHLTLFDKNMLFKFFIRCTFYIKFICASKLKILPCHPLTTNKPFSECAVCTQHCQIKCANIWNLNHSIQFVCFILFLLLASIDKNTLFNTVECILHLGNIFGIWIPNIQIIEPFCWQTFTCSGLNGVILSSPF